MKKLMNFNCIAYYVEFNYTLYYLYATQRTNYTVSIAIIIAFLSLSLILYTFINTSNSRKGFQISRVVVALI